MALAIGKAAPLRPEIRLSQALKSFEAILSAEQLASYDTSPPESTAVMALTCEIDRQNVGRKTRRCGARLTSFLTSVKGFTAVVDIIIGSATNPVASAIWGTVRTSIQVGLFLRPIMSSEKESYSPHPSLEANIIPNTCAFAGLCLTQRCVNRLLQASNHISTRSRRC